MDTSATDLQIIIPGGNFSAKSETKYYLQILPEDLLPAYLQKRRWFASKGVPIKVSIGATTTIVSHSDIILCELEVELGEHTEIYLLPLTVVWDEISASELVQHLAIAQLQQDDRRGYLTDGFATEAMARGIIEGLSARTSLKDSDGTLEFLGTPQLDTMTLNSGTTVQWLSAEQSNSSLIIGGVAIVKLIRHIFSGIHPEVEMTRYLTEQGYKNTAPLLGEVTRTTPDGEKHTLIIVQGAIPNQGDGWSWMLGHLRTACREIIDTQAKTEIFNSLSNFIGNVGTRLGELHAVLSQPSDDDSFAPFTAGNSEVAYLRNGVIQQIKSALSVFDACNGKLEPELAERIQRISEQRDILFREIEKISTTLLGATMIRNHGDFHLGQVLVAGLDAYIIDFEGEPCRSIAERRAKTSPLRDVAGLLRSIRYLAATAVLDAARNGEASSDNRNTLISSFAKDAETLFLSKYFASVETSADLRMKPDQLHRLLDLFLLQKAAYEIEYEAGNRPNWLAIPSRGFIDVAERLLEIT